MSGNEASRAMACLSAIREGRRWLDEKLATHMREHFPPDVSTPGAVAKVPAAPTRRKPKRSPKTIAIALVRSDNAHHVAEFFYVAKELSLFHPDRLRKLIVRHNKDMGDLIGDEERASHMGLARDRIEEATFSVEQEQKIFEGRENEWSDAMLLDQSDLCKLLSPLMAPESCRKILGAMEKGGLLTKRKFRKRLFLSSHGILEDYFQEHLRIIDRAIRGEE